MKPYRNERIIHVIRDLYFTGGRKSFSVQFKHLFPSSYGNDGHVMEREVPVPMVALVATAVSTYLPSYEHTNSNYQLYASIHEWRTGFRQVVEFSASAYLDVYQGHINTLRLIQEKRGKKFHLMMADIYSQAR